MRIETNTQLIKRNRRLANYLFFFSMGVILLALFVNGQLATSRDPNVVGFVSLMLWVILPISLVSTFTSVRLTNQWVRRPRPEEAIPAGLKGLSRKSVLYNYYHLPARHVLVTPHGVYAMTTRFQDGKYTVDGEKWSAPRSALGVLGSFFRRDSIGTPNQEAREAAAYVQNLIATKMPGVEVKPLIIFTNPAAQLSLNNPIIPILYADENKEPNLRDYMKQQAQEHQALLEAAPPSTGKKKPGSKPPEPPPETGSIDAEAVADALEEATIVVV